MRLILVTTLLRGNELGTHAARGKSGVLDNRRWRLEDAIALQDVTTRSVVTRKPAAG